MSENITPTRPEPERLYRSLAGHYVREDTRCVQCRSAHPYLVPGTRPTPDREADHR